jgi:stage II sporulation protein R
MDMRRRHLLPALLAGALLLLLGGAVGLAAPPASPAAPETIIRLHVVANSNSPRDQAVKLLVRDALLQAMAPALQGVGSPARARTWIEEHRRRIAALAKRVLAAAGVGYGARAVFGAAVFPTKEDGGLVLPGGTYEALTVVLGEGRGQNWWCVLFPPLCFVDPGTAVAGTEAASPPELLLPEANGDLRMPSRAPEVRWFFPTLLSRVADWLRGVH